MRWMRAFAATVAAASMLFTGCALDADREDDELDPEARAGQSAALGPRGVAAWNAYVARVTSGAPIQADCRPIRALPSRGTTSRGLVVFFHGFTACPNQFAELAVDLARGGFEVLVPLMPGHGREARIEGDKRIDDVSDLPTIATRTRYATFAAEFNAIAREARGVRIVSGLSVGGMVATSALVQGGDVWTRGLLFAPFFGPPGASRWGSLLAATFHPNGKTGWGEGCVATTKPGGRAGYCEFMFTNLRAATLLGHETLARASEIRVPVQLVGVEADQAADDGLMARLLGRVQGDKAGCFYAKGMPHAFISKHDNQHLDHAWLPALHRATLAFAREGTWFGATGKSSEYEYPFCAPE
jgi:alpha-beta hydrolase superfamily lysophospholipase